VRPFRQHGCVRARLGSALAGTLVAVFLILDILIVPGCRAQQSLNEGNAKKPLLSQQDRDLEPKTLELLGAIRRHDAARWEPRLHVNEYSAATERAVRSEVASVAATLEDMPPRTVGVVHSSLWPDFAWVLVELGETGTARSQLRTVFYAREGADWQMFPRQGTLFEQGELRWSPGRPD
jgi:hypothetical protein